MKSFAEIEKILLEAPNRMFKDFDLNGYFAPELKEKFGVTEDEMEIMLNRRSMFKWKLLTYKGERKYFFYLKF